MEARIAVTICRLGSNVEYRTISALFLLGCSIVGEIVIDICEMVATHLIPKYVHIPKGIVLEK